MRRSSVSPSHLLNPTLGFFLMSQSNPWIALATFAEEIAPVAQDALNAVASVSNAVVRADNRLELQEQSVKLLSSNDE